MKETEEWGKNLKKNNIEMYGIYIDIERVKTNKEIKGGERILERQR